MISVVYIHIKTTQKPCSGVSPELSFTNKNTQKNLQNNSVQQGASSELQLNYSFRTDWN